MFGEKRDDERMHISYEASELYGKFSTGVVREKFESLLRDKSFESYFEEKLSSPCKKAVEALPEGKAKEFMRETRSIMNLWFNLRINLMQNAVRKAFIGWLHFGRNIDKELEEILTIDFGKQMIEIFADATLTMIEKSSEIFEKVASEEKKVEGFLKEKEKNQASTNKKSFLN